MTPEACKAARALAGLTQRQLAELANVSTQTVADYERGARTPHRNNLRAMRTALEQLGIDFIWEQNVIIGVKKKPSGADPKIL